MKRMRADARFIVIVYSPNRGNYWWQTFEFKSSALDWINKQKEKRPYALRHEIYLSLRGIRARMREHFRWDERGLAWALHDCINHYAGEDAYPMPAVDMESINLDDVAGMHI